MISPQAAEIRASLAPETVDDGVSVAEERAAWEGALTRAPLPPGMVERSVTIAGVDCLRVDLAGAPPARPTMLYAHGGGFTTGSVSTHRSFCIDLATATDLPIVSVGYRLLPEHTFPAPVDDIVAVATALGPDLVFVGDSSGAALVVSAAIELRRAGGPTPSRIVSFSGAFDATLSGPSIDSAEDPQLSRPVLEHWKRTISRVCDPADPLVSPLFADLTGLAPVLLLTGGDEVWRSDSERMHGRLVDHGAASSLVVHDGMWHVWPLAGDFPEARLALGQVRRFLTPNDL